MYIFNCKKLHVNPYVKSTLPNKSRSSNRRICYRVGPSSEPAMTQEEMYVHTNQTNSSQNDFSCLPGANPNVPTSLRDLHQITNVRSNITKCTYHITRNRVDMSEPAFGKGVSYHSSTTPYHTPHTPCSLLSDTVLQSATPVLPCTTKY